MTHDLGFAPGAPLPSETDILIIGGGILGLSLAYNLATLGERNVTVVEQRYLTYGASGRNGGGVRMQWSTATNIELMQESIDLCKHFVSDLGVNVWLRQGGYLFLAQNQSEQEKMARNVELQNRSGVPTRMLTPAEAHKMVPQLDVSSVVAACFNARDGVVFPWPFLWGYAKEAAARGVAIHTFTSVEAIDQIAQGYQVRTNRGTIKATRVVLAAGAWSPPIARMVGLDLPSHPERHEILASEPLKPFLGPMVSVLSSGLYFSQSMRGEIITGITLKHAATGDADQVHMGSTLTFLTEIARELTRFMPRLASVKVMRQWAGCYDITPDGNPLIGEAPGLPGFFLCSGFMGHGFMMAPVIGKYYAAFLARNERHEFFDRWRFERFQEGNVEAEDMIIG